MRYIGSLPNSKESQSFSFFLNKEKINHTFEKTPNNLAIWIENEEQISIAKENLEIFRKDPMHPKFAIIKDKLSLANEHKEKKHKKNIPVHKKNLLQQNSIFQSKLTFSFLLLCCMIFLFQENDKSKPLDNFQSSSYIFSSPVNRELLFDYPYSFQLIQKLLNLYSIDQLKDPTSLPEEGQYLLQKQSKTPYWQGYYTLITNTIRTKGSFSLANYTHSTPWFEKISQGEFWRLFTPCLLHGDLMHLLFNMLWLIVLGKQVESRLGAFRTLFCFILIGCISNLCQYLISGPNFLGFSGVICGILAFIWVRQKKSPWEGYLLPRSTFYFVSFVMLTMLTIQIISFFMEIKGLTSIAPNIANTAHLSGALCGYLLAYIPLFNSRSFKAY